MKKVLLIALLALTAQAKAQDLNQQELYVFGQTQANVLYKGTGNQVLGFFGLGFINSYVVTDRRNDEIPKRFTKKLLRKGIDKETVNNRFFERGFIEQINKLSNEDVAAGAAVSSFLAIAVVLASL